jgi:hypothetical protein
MRQAIRASVYRQAAIARFAEAEYLKEAHPAGAIYLGGYVVECMLKWAICQRHAVIYPEDLPDQKLSEQLTGARGHDLKFLFDASGLRSLLEPDNQLKKAYEQTLFWNVALRYDPKAGKARDAIQFLASVRKLRDWLEGI